MRWFLREKGLKHRAETKRSKIEYVEEIHEGLEFRVTTQTSLSVAYISRCGTAEPRQRETAMLPRSERTRRAQCQHSVMSIRKPCRYRTADS